MNYTDFISSNGYICTESEFEIAKAHAKNKLAVIISRFGDANGERLEDYYLEQLIREELRAERVSKALFEMQLAGKRNPALLRNSNTGLNKKKFKQAHYIILNRKINS